MKPIVRALMRANDELNGEEAHMSGPSEAAVRVACNCAPSDPRAVLAAAHDPANFEDPMDVSVRLGDVVEALRHEGDPSLGGGYHDAADYLLRTFGGDRA